MLFSQFAQYFSLMSVTAVLFAIFIIWLFPVTVVWWTSRGKLVYSLANKLHCSWHITQIGA